MIKKEGSEGLVADLKTLFVSLFTEALTEGKEKANQDPTEAYNHLIPDLSSLGLEKSDLTVDIDLGGSPMLVVKLDSSKHEEAASEVAYLGLFNECIETNDPQGLGKEDEHLMPEILKRAFDAGFDYVYFEQVL